MVRAPYVDKKGLKKGAWSEEEDNKLKAYILRYKAWNWSHLPRFAGLARSGKSCRMRWENYLKPGLKRGGFSKEEEEIILRMQQKHGNKWALIAKSLPGRTDNEIKNYWHTILSKSKKQDPSLRGLVEIASETGEEMQVLYQNTKPSETISISDDSTQNGQQDSNSANTHYSSETYTSSCSPTLSVPIGRSGSDPSSFDMSSTPISPCTSYNPASTPETYKLGEESMPLTFQSPEEMSWIEPVLTASSKSPVLSSISDDFPLVDGTEWTAENCLSMETSLLLNNDLNSMGLSEEAFESLWSEPLSFDSFNTSILPSTIHVTDEFRNSEEIFFEDLENFSIEPFSMEASDSPTLSSTITEFPPWTAEHDPSLENPTFPGNWDLMEAFSQPLTSFGCGPFHWDSMLDLSSTDIFSSTRFSSPMVTQDFRSPDEIFSAACGSILTEPISMDASNSQILPSMESETSTVLSHLDSLESFGFWNSLWVLLQ